MQTVQTMPHAVEHSATQQPLISSVRYDWAFSLLSGLLVGGAYNDAWAHDHGKVDQSFFTPWHGLLYSAMLLVGLFLVATALRNGRRGASWRQALPVGYTWSLAGVGLFAVGGLGDMIWHIVFGIEADLEALLSPTHLLLAGGWMLIVSGPWRASWRRASEEASWGAQLPKLLSLTFMLSVLTFFTVYAHPFAHVLAGGSLSGASETSQALGVAGFLVQPAFFMGLALLALRRWSLPFGSLTLMFTLNTALVSVLHDVYILIPMAALAGLLADLLYMFLRPSDQRRGALRLFAFAVPALLYMFYFLLLILTVGIAWTPSLWIGAIVLAGVVGLLLSYLVFPPPSGQQIGY